MKKHIVTHIKTVDPAPTNNIAAGYNTGQEWINTTTGERFYHKTDGVWDSTASFWNHGAGTNATVLIGGGNTADGNLSLAEGIGNIALGDYSHAEGKYNEANGEASHAEGWNTYANGEQSHAEGIYSEANGDWSHAEGSSTTAAGVAAHSEGESTYANGDWSHAQNFGTIASGDYSHAGGQGTVASGTNSFVHGDNSTASNTNTIVLGANIDGTVADTTYVDKLNIKNGVTVGSTPFTENHAKLNSMQSATGLYSFASGGITMASTTQFNVGAVQGFIVDSDNPLAAPIAVNYLGGSNLSTPFISTAPATHILVKPDSTLLMINTEPTVTQRRDNIYLGVVGHPGLTSLSGIGNSPDLCLNIFSQLRAFVHPIRFINEGIIPYAGAASLALYNTAGALYGLGIGFVANGNDAPTVLQMAGGAPTTFQYRTQTGAAEANTTVLIPNYYDVAGVKTLNGGANGSATIQRVYLLQNGNIRVQYGQTVYGNLSTAVSAASSDPFVVFSNNKTLGILIGMIALTKDCTDLTNTTKAQFLPVSKFGETVGAAAGISTSTSQSAYNNSTNPEIVTNSVLGAFTIKRGSAADTDNIFEGQNGAGVTKYSVDGNGKITGTSIVKSGFTVGTPKYLMDDGSSLPINQYLLKIVIASGVITPTKIGGANVTLPTVTYSTGTFTVDFGITPGIFATGNISHNPSDGSLRTLTLNFSSNITFRCYSGGGTVLSDATTDGITVYLAVQLP